jgi:hypothetical protein
MSVQGVGAVQCGWILEVVARQPRPVGPLFKIVPNEALLKQTVSFEANRYSAGLLQVTGLLVNHRIGRPPRRPPL